MSLIGAVFLALLVDSPQAVAVDEAGRVYYSDLATQAISRIDGGTINVVEAGPRRIRTALYAVRDLEHLPGSAILAADSATGMIYRIGDGPAESLTDPEFQVPSGIAVVSPERLLVCDQRLNRLVAVDLTAKGEMSTVAELPAPRDVAVLPTGGFAVLCLGDEPIQKVEEDGKRSTLVAGRVFGQANSIVYWPIRNSLMVSDGYRGTLWEIPVGGGEPVAWKQGAPLKGPAGLAVSGDSLFVADPAAGQVFRIAADGSTTPLLPGRD